ncbi:MAG: hypothetical protein Q7J55_00730 [bacterium]|nr:hypothetical protein [bacterium]
MNKKLDFGEQTSVNSVEPFGPERFSSEQFSLEQFSLELTAERLTAERFTALLTAKGLSRTESLYQLIHSIFITTLWDIPKF